MAVTPDAVGLPRGLGADLAALRQAAEAATPGPWRVEDETWIDAGDYDSVIAPATPECMAYCYGGSSRIDITAEDAAFIAAANPTAVLALLDRLEAAEATLARLRAIPAMSDDELNAALDTP